MQAARSSRCPCRNSLARWRRPLMSRSTGWQRAHLLAPSAAPPPTISALRAALNRCHRHAPRRRRSPARHALSRPTACVAGGASAAAAHARASALHRPQQRRSRSASHAATPPSSPNRQRRRRLRYAQNVRPCRCRLASDRRTQRPWAPIVPVSRAIVRCRLTQQSISRRSSEPPDGFLRSADTTCIIRRIPPRTMQCTRCSCTYHAAEYK